jgi:hypothetical protein
MRTVFVGWVGWVMGVGGLLLAGGATACGATLYDDSFDDNAIGAQWTLLADDASHLNLLEQNQRLEMIATAPASSTTDALYLSNGPAGFRLSTAQDFHITIDYSFTGYSAVGGSGTALALDFGVGRDLDGTDSAAVGVGYATESSFGFPITLQGAVIGYRIDDAGTQTQYLLPPSTGTFDIAYDAAGDDLTLGIEGTSISSTLADTVRGVWGADDLLVSFGARGNGFSTASGNAWLDNFTILEGTTVPEPMSSALLGFGAAGMLLKRRRA